MTLLSSGVSRSRPTRGSDERFRGLAARRQGASREHGEGQSNPENEATESRARIWLRRSHPMSFCLFLGRAAEDRVPPVRLGQILGRWGFAVSNRCACYEPKARGDAPNGVLHRFRLCLEENHIVPHEIVFVIKQKNWKDPSKGSQQHEWHKQRPFIRIPHVPSKKALCRSQAGCSWYCGYPAASTATGARRAFTGLPCACSPPRHRLGAAP